MYSKLFSNFKNSSGEEQEEILTALALLINANLKEDEKKYKEIGLPDLKDHLKAHNEISRALISFKTQFINRKIKNSEFIDDFLEYLSLWQIKHKEQMDDKADSYIRIEGFIKKHEK